MQFYRWSTLLPITFPTLAIGIILTQPTGSFAVSGAIGDILGYLAYSLLIGGVPYCIISLFLLWWFRDREARFYAAFSWVFPLVFCVFFFACWLVLSIVSGNSGGPPLFTVLWFTSVILILGYSYVFLTHILAFALGKAGYLTDN